MSEDIKDELTPEDEENEVIELIDDDGNVVKFVLCDITEYKGEKYTMLLPAEPNESVAEDEVAIFKYKEDEGVLEPIEDDALLDEVFEFWQNELDAEEAEGEEN